MGALTLLNHIANFLAPALWLALGLAVVSRIIIKKKASAHSLIKQTAILFAVCTSVLLLGLLFFGRDGKMLTYAALVVAGAGAQGWLQRQTA